MEGIPDIFLLWAHRNARYNGTREEASPAAPDGWDTAGQTGGREDGRRTVPEYTAAPRKARSGVHPING